MSLSSTLSSTLSATLSSSLDAGEGAPVPKDQDALDYIELIELRGATPDYHQKKAINDWFVTGKEEGWYSAIHRLYLPVWGLAAANSVDLTTLNDGVFSGTLNHSNGFLAGSTDGELEFDISPAAAGITGNAGGGLTALLFRPPSPTGYKAHLALSGVNQSIQLYSEAPGYVRATVAGSPIASYLKSNEDQLGVFHSSRTSATSLTLYQLEGAGFFSRATNNGSVAGNITPSSNMTALTQGGAIPSDAAYGALAMTEGMDATMAESYSRSLMELWHTVTRLDPWTTYITDPQGNVIRDPNGNPITEPTP